VEYLIKLPSCLVVTHGHPDMQWLEGVHVSLFVANATRKTQTFLKEQQMHLDILMQYYYIIITDMFRPPVCPSSGEGVENKHTSTIIMCRNHSTVKQHMLYLVCFLTVRVKVMYIIYIFFNCGVVSTHYNCVRILVLITLRMATWVAETCRWLLHNKLTFIYWSVFVGPFF
jgi:hypothetical protein